MTAQQPDQLLYEGSKHSLLSNPLEQYFVHHPPRPNFTIPSTDNWRGYVAEWEIAGARLYLAGILGDICTRAPQDGVKKAGWCFTHHAGDCETRAAGLGDFPGQAGARVFADWYSGEIVVPLGDMVEYVHMGYESAYERYLLIAVSRGGISATRTLERKEFERQGEADE